MSALPLSKAEIRAQRKAQIARQAERVMRRELDRANRAWYQAQVASAGLRPVGRVLSPEAVPFDWAAAESRSVDDAGEPLCTVRAVSFSP